MESALIEHFRRYIKINEPEIPDILAHFQKIKLRRKENILEQDNLCRSNFFVSKGCLRMFFLRENGNEQTTQFAIENWWITDYMAFLTRKPATYFIQAVENSILYGIDQKSLGDLLDKFPKIERYFRLVQERSIAASQSRIRYLYDLSKEELYKDFEHQFPEFVQRVPQYLLASFLGLTPEYLSEIRRKSLF